MLSLDDFIEQVSADAGGVLLCGGDEAKRRDVAAKIHAKRKRTDALGTSVTGAAEGATLYLKDGADLSFADQEAILQNSARGNPWKIVCGVEARYELHDAVSEERLRPAVYHLLSAHFYDFDKNLAAVAKR